MPFTPPADSSFLVDHSREVLFDRAERLAADAGCDFLDAVLLLEAEATPYRPPPGFTVDPVSERLHRAALTFQIEHAGASYLAAVDAVELQAQPPEGVQGVVTLHLRASSPLWVELKATADVSSATFGGLAYSGGVVPNFGFAGDLAIDLATLSAPARVPVLLNHDPNQIVGHASVSNDRVTLQMQDGRFSNSTEAARIVSGTRAEGQPWALSVGINGRYEAADRAKWTELNGRTLNVDTIMRNARLLEVSFVPSGADPDARAA
jgi:hypothetical protein